MKNPFFAAGLCLLYHEAATVNVEVAKSDTDYRTDNSYPQRPSAVGAS
jgi:hypothetical protein